MIKAKIPLGFQWPTLEPFLFCVHHLDHFPEGNGEYGPAAAHLKGRAIGSDFEVRNGFRMYHGETVPGFPVHPHRGFETVTIVRKGYVDHADSMGAAGRYGQGDVQWMTAGQGVQHSEMFPLLREDQKNTVELFQIWLNLPRAKKMVSPHFTMFWSEQIPEIISADGQSQVSVIAGEFNGVKALAPPPDSWAAQAESEVAIYILKVKAGAEVKVSGSLQQIGRVLYFFEGQKAMLNEHEIESGHAYQVESKTEFNLRAVDRDIEILLLQARAIGEPVVQHGPFVMNTKDEIIKTFDEYQRTQFGGWSWPRPDMVHGPQIERFAQYPDGKIQKPEQKN